MEKRLKTPDLFKFPFFEAICWFVAKNLLETLKGSSCFKKQRCICFYFGFVFFFSFLFIDNGEN